MTELVLHLKLKVGNKRMFITNDPTTTKTHSAQLHSDILKGFSINRMLENGVQYREKINLIVTSVVDVSN